MDISPPSKIEYMTTWRIAVKLTSWQQWANPARNSLCKTSSLVDRMQHNTWKQWRPVTDKALMCPILFKWSFRNFSLALEQLFTKKISLTCINFKPSSTVGLLNSKQTRTIWTRGLSSFQLVGVAIPAKPRTTHVRFRNFYLWISNSNGYQYRLRIAHLDFFHLRKRKQASVVPCLEK